MLDLNAPTRSVLGVELAADTADPLLFHAFPAPPQVAVLEGRPDVELLRFVRDGSLTGGHLRLSVDVGHPPGRLDEVAAALTAERVGATEPNRVSPVVVTAAVAQLVFLGREPNDQGGLSPLFTRPYADATAQISPPHLASFAVDLTPEGVGVVEAALRSPDTGPSTDAGGMLAVVYRLQVEGLWPAQRVVARVDWGRAYEQLSVHFKQGHLLEVTDLAQVVEELREDSAIVVSAVQSLTPEQGGGPGDLDVANAWIQRELVERFCEPVLPLDRRPAHVSLGTAGEIFGVGTQFAARHLTSVERAVATVDFQRAAVLVRSYTVQAQLADVLPVGDVSGFIVDAGLDHPFFSRFTLRVRAAAPLADLHLEEVAGDFAYGTAHRPIRLTPDAAEAMLDSWADASPDRSWAVQVTARFAADAPIGPDRQVVLAPITGDNRELTLDLEQLLGLARVDLAQAPDPRVLVSTATVRHWRPVTGPDEVARWQQQAEQACALTGEQPAATAWFADRRPSDRLDVWVRHLLADGRMVTGDPLPVDSTAVVLPPSIPTALTVQLIADDDWAADGVRQIAVALQRQEDDPALTVMLTGPGATVVADLDLPDPVDRAYRYRTTRLLTAGGEVVDDWRSSDRSVLLVGGSAGQQLVVDLTPVGLELPTAGVLLVEVELLYLDPAHQVRDQQTLVVRALADRPRWQVPIVDPSRRSYQYRVTVHRTAGGVTVGDWTTATDRLLPIPITPAPAPVPTL